MDTEMTGDVDSVDLTEDEDSRETIVDVPLLPKLQRIVHVSPTKPPPLTPIQKFTSFQNNDLNNQQVMKVPKLTKIKGSLSTSNQQLVTRLPQTSSTNLETVCLDSDDEEMKQTHFDKFTANSSKVSGKVVIIKKNNKYYRIIIPHNVMPAVNKHEGPVLINIPGVGPLVIKLDPKAKELTTNNLEPFSLNFDDIMDSVSNQCQSNFTMQPSEHKNLKKTLSNRNTKCSKEDLLSDTRFCWTINKNRYRNDRYVYTYRDFLGFSKAECYRAKKCFNIMDRCLNKKKLALKNKIKMQKLHMKNNATLNKGKEIVYKHITDQVIKRIRSNQSGTFKTFIPEPFQRFHNLNAKLPPNTVITHNDYNDLLLTKKVVILKGKEKKASKSTRSRRRKISKQKTLQKSSNENNLTLIKPCFVQIDRDELIEQMTRKASIKHITTHVNLGNNKTSSPIKQLKSKTKDCTPSPINQLKSKNKEYMPSLKVVWGTFRSKLITDQASFKKEIAYIKPLLILNEYNFKLVNNYATEFTRRNIIYSVDRDISFPKSLLTNREFLSAVETGYIKLVLENILCSFLKGEFGPKSTDISMSFLNNKCVMVSDE